MLDTIARLTDDERGLMRGMALQIFTAILGEPTVHTKADVRWNTKGSLRFMPSGIVYDFSEGKSFDPIDLLMHRERLSFAQALDWIRGFTGGADASVAKAERNSTLKLAVSKVWPDYCKDIWDAGRPLPETALEYFRGRGVSVDGCVDIRFHPDRMQIMFEMMLPDGRPSTLMTIDPASGKKGFIKGCKKQGTATLLARPPVITNERTICVSEGVINAFSFWRFYSHTRATEFEYWSAGDADNLKRFDHDRVLLGRCVELIIAADNDTVGLAAANHLKDRYEAKSIPTTIVIPHGHKDFNDLLMGVKP